MSQVPPRFAPPGHLRLLLVTSTGASLGGSDRDWMTLANALAPEAVTILWVGSEGSSEVLRPHLDSRVSIITLRPGLPFFTYMVAGDSRQERSAWLWTKILIDHARRLVAPLWQLERALGTKRPDIVVSNTVGVTLGALYAILHQRPHIWFVKECLDTSREAPRSFARWIERLSRTVVVPSQAVARAFCRRVVVLPDGSDVAQIRASAATGPPRAEVLGRLGLPPERPVVAQVGGLSWLKGQHVTVAALGHLAAEHAATDFSLLFLGGGVGNAYHRELERQLESTVPAWRERVRFARFSPEDFSYLAASDIVVHPSVFPDSYPNAVREAMILGKPVIATREGGLPEMIRNGDTGTLVAPGDPIELSAALLELLRSAARREAMGRRGQEHALATFNIETRMDHFLHLFRAAASH